MLDASVQTQVPFNVLELKRSLTGLICLLPTFPRSARFLCDRIAVMNAGQIVELGPTQEIFCITPAPIYSKPAPSCLISLNSNASMILHGMRRF